MKIKIVISLILSKILLLFGYQYDSSCIPSGPYCYTPDYEKMKNKDSDDFTYYIKPCKYYKRISRNINGCKYLGVITNDFLFSDMCKLCNKNNDE